MPTLQSYSAVSIDPTFIQKVKFAAIQTAINISSEATSTTNHVSRIAFAKAVLITPDAYAPMLAQGAATQVSGVAATDTEILNAISAIWEDYAGKP
jgi:hypothetical protein